MVTISVKVQDELVQLYGIEAIKKLLEEELEYQRFRLLETGYKKPCLKPVPIGRKNLKKAGKKPLKSTNAEEQEIENQFVVDVNKRL